MMPLIIANAVCMNPQPTPEQQRDFENALKIGEVLASTVEIVDSPRIRVNPHTLKEAVGIYNTLGGKKPFLQSSQQFVINCLLYSAETFAACSHRVVLCHITGRDVAYWYGNGIVKDREPLDNVRFFVGDNSFLIASMLINKAIYLRLQTFLAPQSDRQRQQLAALESIPKYKGPPADPKTAAKIDALLAEVRGETKRDTPPEISRERAMAVFHERYRQSLVRWFEITDTVPDGCEFEDVPRNCWFVQFFLTYDDPTVWPQNRLVAVSKNTGEIVYDGNANDDG